MLPERKLSRVRQDERLHCPADRSSVVHCCVAVRIRCKPGHNLSLVACQSRSATARRRIGVLRARHCTTLSTGVLDPDAALQQQDRHTASIAAMLSRHLAQLQAGPCVQPHGTPMLSEGFQRRLQRQRLRSVVCIQVSALQSAQPAEQHAVEYHDRPRSCEELSLSARSSRPQEQVAHVCRACPQCPAVTS